MWIDLHFLTPLRRRRSKQTAHRPATSLSRQPLTTRRKIPTQKTASGNMGTTLTTLQLYTSTVFFMLHGVNDWNTIDVFAATGTLRRQRTSRGRPNPRNIIIWQAPFLQVSRRILTSVEQDGQVQTDTSITVTFDALCIDLRVVRTINITCVARNVQGR